MADRTAPPPARELAVHQPLPHDSADLHVAGAANYVDDLPEAPGTLHLAFGLAADGHARLTGLDLTEVRAAPDVVAVFTAADIPGENNVGPVFHDDLLFARTRSSIRASLCSSSPRPATAPRAPPRGWRRSRPRAFPRSSPSPKR